MFRSVLIFMTCLFAVSYGNIYPSYEATHSVIPNYSEKVYVSSDQLICSNSGIFVLLEDSNGNLSKVLISQLCWDENGLFVLATHLPLPEAAWCRHGHKVCDRCYKCNVPDCPSYGCKCKR